MNTRISLYDSVMIYNSQTKIKEHYKNFSIVQDIMSFSYFCYNSVKMIIPQYNLSDQYIRQQYGLEEYHEKTSFNHT